MSPGSVSTTWCRASSTERATQPRRATPPSRGVRTSVEARGGVVAQARGGAPAARPRTCGASRSGCPPKASTVSRIDATSTAVVPRAVPEPTTPDPIPTTIRSACCTCRARVIPLGHRHRLQVAAEGVARGDRAREEAAVDHRGHEVRQREREGRPVGHHVGDPQARRLGRAAATTTAGIWLWTPHTTTGMPSSVAGRSRCSSSAPPVSVCRLV